MHYNNIPDQDAYSKQHDCVNMNVIQIVYTIILSFTAKINLQTDQKIS